MPVHHVHVPAERAELVVERVEGVGLLGPRALLEPVAVDHRGEVGQRRCPAVIAASQLLPSCSSPSPSTT